MDRAGTAESVAERHVVGAGQVDQAVVHDGARAKAASRAECPELQGAARHRGDPSVGIVAVQHQAAGSGLGQFART
ncbi:hypothetical protein G6F22_021032 [Rhizopus arrhizus]|nr:hypothetical protein G6F22_021032 [Rhizopus arrhizus]